MQVLPRVDPDRIRTLLDGREFFWLDVCDPRPDELEFLGRALELHELAVEDAQKFGQRPKFEPYGRHLVVVFFGAAGGRADAPAEPYEVHLFVSGDWVVTAHRGDADLFAALQSQLGAPGGAWSEDFVVYRILDALTDTFFPVVEAVEAQVDALEAAVLEHPRREDLGRIYRLKQQVQDLERHSGPQRELFPPLSRALLALPGLEHSTGHYLRDVEDHLARVSGELRRQAGDLASLTDTYFNANADRINVISQRLGVLAAIFLPLSFVTGFFGQNFGWLVDSIDSRNDFLAFGVAPLATVLTISVALLLLRGRRSRQRHLPGPAVPSAASTQRASEHSGRK